MSTAIASQLGDSPCARILCVGDDVVHLLDIPQKLDADHDFVIAGSIEEGYAVLETEPAFDLIISGPATRDPRSNEFFERLHAHSPYAERILVTCHGDRDAIRMATNDARVMRVLLRPCADSVLREAVYDALLRHRARTLRAQLGHMVTPSHAMLALSTTPKDVV